MRKITNALLILVIAGLIAGCASPMVLSAPASILQANQEASPTYIVAPPDATPTPTPFRPIPPTPIIYPTGTPQPTSTPTVTPTSTSEVDAFLGEMSLEQVPDQMNILLLGSDARPGVKKWFRTDTIILATLNWDLGIANLTSFPRDLWVTIPGHGEDRINTAFEYGGFDMIADTFSYNFGVRPEHYVLIDFSNFKRFVDELGGLEVNVGKKLQDYRSGYLTTIPAGKVSMDADTVLWSARSRKTTNDFERNRRQQEVLMAIIEEVLNLNNIRRAPELYEIYKDTVRTDLSLPDILPMLPLAVKLTDTSRFHNYFVGSGQVTSWITPGGAMVLLPDRAKVRKTIRKSQNLAP
jgi:LCP family protein required for cell wall assembly